MIKKKVKEIANFDGGNDFIEELFLITQDEDDVTGILLLLGSSEKCMELWDFIKKHKNLESDNIWEKAIGISKKNERIPKNT